MTTNISYQAVMATPLGRIGIRMAGDAASALDYLAADALEQPPADTATAAVVAQLEAYFHDPRYQFTVPLAPGGTTFQQRVWAALQAIPSGTVLTWRPGVATRYCRPRHRRGLPHQSPTDPDSLSSRGGTARVGGLCRRGHRRSAGDQTLAVAA